jgi:hypothetical protein
MRLSRIIEQSSGRAAGRASGRAAGRASGLAAGRAAVHVPATETPCKRRASAAEDTDNVCQELLRKNKIHRKRDAVFVAASEGPEKKGGEFFDESTAIAKVMCVAPMFGIMSWSFLDGEAKERFWQLLVKEEVFNRQYEKRNADPKGACWEMLRALAYCEVGGRDTYQERMDFQWNCFFAGPQRRRAGGGRERGQASGVDDNAVPGKLAPRETEADPRDCSHRQPAGAGHARVRYRGRSLDVHCLQHPRPRELLLPGFKIVRRGLGDRGPAAAAPGGAVGQRREQGAQNAEEGLRPGEYGEPNQHERHSQGHQDHHARGRSQQHASFSADAVAAQGRGLDALGADTRRAVLLTLGILGTFSQNLAGRRLLSTMIEIFIDRNTGHFLGTFGQTR